MGQTAEAAAKTEECPETFNSEVENIIFQTLPERIVHLHELIGRPEFRISADYSECPFRVVPTTVAELAEDDCRICSGGQTSDDEKPAAAQDAVPFAPSNKNIAESVEILKPIVAQLVVDNRAIRLWLTLLIPKIEDGNNFGVSVQKNVLGLTQQVEAATEIYFRKVAGYREGRGNLIAKVVRYPLVEDYRIAVDELDEKHHTDMALIAHEIYLCYTLLYDVIVKNFEKLTNPRSSNVGSLY